MGDSLIYKYYPCIYSDTYKWLSHLIGGKEKNLPGRKFPSICIINNSPEDQINFTPPLNFTYGLDIVTCFQREGENIVT